MPEKIEAEKVSDDYLKTLEEVKKQYRQYVEVNELYKLPIQKEEQIVQYKPPSPEHPLTTNRIRLNAPYSRQGTSLPFRAADFQTSSENSTINSPSEKGSPARLSSQARIS